MRKWLKCGIAAVVSLSAALSLFGCGPNGGEGGNDTESEGGWTVVTPASCESTGLKERTVNGVREEEPIPALGHDYGSWNVDSDADCTRDGYRWRICNRCNDRDDDTIEAKGHSVPESLFYDEDTHYYECTVCHEQFDADGHDLILIGKKTLKIAPYFETFTFSLANEWYHLLSEYYGKTLSEIPTIERDSTYPFSYMDYGSETHYECRDCSAKIIVFGLLEKLEYDGYRYSFSYDEDYRISTIVKTQSASSYYYKLDFTYDKDGRFLLVERNRYYNFEPEINQQCRLELDYDSDEVVTVSFYRYYSGYGDFLESARYQVYLMDGQPYELKNLYYRITPVDTNGAEHEVITWYDNGFIDTYKVILYDSEEIYEYDEHGYIVQRTWFLGTKTYSYEYDSNGNVTRYEDTTVDYGSVDYTYYQFIYEYDSNCNITSCIVFKHDKRSYNDFETVLTSVNVTNTYDADGRLTERYLTDPNYDPVTPYYSEMKDYHDIYIYDALGNLTQWRRTTISYSDSPYYVGSEMTETLLTASYLGGASLDN